MDVPSWHPANQNADALRRLAMTGGGPSQRIEFNEVNTLTDEERQMVIKDENIMLGGGRGLLDASDRMYLVEQTLLEQEAKNREHIERQAALQIFRSNASKAHALKPTMFEIPKGTRKKTFLSPEKPAGVVVKVKKRKNKTDVKEKKFKKAKKTPILTRNAPEVDDTRKSLEKQIEDNDVSWPLSKKSSATALLTEDYSSDDGQ